MASSCPTTYTLHIFTRRHQHWPPVHTRVRGSQVWAAEDTKSKDFPTVSLRGSVRGRHKSYLLSMLRVILVLLSFFHILLILAIVQNPGCCPLHRGHRGRVHRGLHLQQKSLVAFLQMLTCWVLKAKWFLGDTSFLTYILGSMWCMINASNGVGPGNIHLCENSSAQKSVCITFKIHAFSLSIGSQGLTIVN